MELDFRKLFMIATAKPEFSRNAEEIITCNVFFFNWFIPMMCSDFKNEELWKELSNHETNESFLKLKKYVESM